MHVHRSRLVGGDAAGLAAGALACGPWFARPADDDQKRGRCWGPDGKDEKGHWTGMPCTKGWRPTSLQANLPMTLPKQEHPDHDLTPVPAPIPGFASQ
eukprot:867788-Pelagomonas_calceolata.AAC.10